MNDNNLIRSCCGCAIQLKVRLNTAYFAENWKYCSKIIFKYVNSTVEPIFNESLIEKRDLWTMHGTNWLLKNALLPKKRKRKKKRRHKADKLNSNTY